MNIDAANQIGQALDMAFGRLGFTQFALQNLAALNLIAEAVRAEQERQKAAARDDDNG